MLKRARPTGEEAKKIAKELRDWVGKEIGPIAKPKDIRFGDNLPKTRSGKIMRRLLRALAKGEEITQDVSTLENPAILDQLRGVDTAGAAAGVVAVVAARRARAAAAAGTPRAARKARTAAKRGVRPTGSGAKKKRSAARKVVRSTGARQALSRVKRKAALRRSGKRVGPRAAPQRRR